KYFVSIYCCNYIRHLLSFPTRRSSDLNLSHHDSIEVVLPEISGVGQDIGILIVPAIGSIRSSYPVKLPAGNCFIIVKLRANPIRSEEHTSELQSRENIVCRLLLDKKIL